MKLQFRHRNNSGFTLIEMIVSIGVFITAMLLIVSALVSLDNAARKARAVRIASDNLSAALDSMSRNIRMGSSFHCGCGTAGVPSTAGDASFPDGPRDCLMTDDLGSGGDVCIAFDGQNGSPGTPTDQIVYRLSENRIQRSTDGGATYIDLTAPEINITDLKFFVSGTTYDQDQPTVTMIIRGKTGVNQKTQTAFNVQTTIGARTPNYAP